MDAVSNAGISAEFSASRTSQQIATTVLKQQAQTEQAVGEMVEQVAKSSPAAPGQGQNVDKRV